jgi:hypothetical protein
MIVFNTHLMNDFLLNSGKFFDRHFLSAPDLMGAVGQYSDTHFVRHAFWLTYYRGVISQTGNG